MIVGYFHVEGVAVSPGEAYPVLVVDPDTVLSTAVPAKFLQSIPRWISQIPKFRRCVEHAKLSLCDIGWGSTARSAGTPDFFGRAISKRPDHECQ